MELHALEEEMGIAHLDAEASEEERAAWLERENALKEEAEAKVRFRVCVLAFVFAFASPYCFRNRVLFSFLVVCFY